MSYVLLYVRALGFQPVGPPEYPDPSPRRENKNTYSDSRRARWVDLDVYITNDIMMM